TAVRRTAGNGRVCRAASRLGVKPPTVLLVMTTAKPPDKPRAERLARIEKTDAEWRAQLTDMQYRVARLHGTERAFSGCYWDHHEEGRYLCVCCGTPLFASGQKYDSGSGWPSWWQPIDEAALVLRRDTSHGMLRTE